MSPIRVPKTRQADRMSMARAKDTDECMPRAMMRSGAGEVVVAGVGVWVKVASSKGVREFLRERK